MALRGLMKTVYELGGEGTDQARLSEMWLVFRDVHPDLVFGFWFNWVWEQRKEPFCFCYSAF
jgi:hypothetical protein